MTVRSTYLGHDIEWDHESSVWLYSDTKEICTSSIKDKRSCPKCLKFPTENGHDPCIRNLPGVKHACCGHGELSKDLNDSHIYAIMEEDDELMILFKTLEGMKKYFKLED